MCFCFKAVAAKAHTYSCRQSCLFPDSQTDIKCLGNDKNSHTS